MTHITHHDQEVVHICLLPEAKVARSEFPHPLITVDYDAEDKIIAISAVGLLRIRLVRAYADWLAGTNQDAATLVKTIT